MSSQRFSRPGLLAIVLSTLLGAGCTTRASLQPFYQLTYAELLGPSVKPDGFYRVVFTSEDSLALLVGTGACRLFVIEHHGDEWRPVATAVACGLRNEVYAAGDGQVLVDLGNEKLLYSPDLKSAGRIPIRNMLASPLRGSRTVAAYETNNWTAYRLLPKYQPLASGPGEVQSISDQFVVFREGFVVHTQTIDGVERGAFRVNVRHVQEAEIIGDNRLFRSTESGDQIITFDGKKIASIPETRGFGGWDHRWSADQQRIVYDRITRDVPVLQRAAEILLAIVTLGIRQVNEAPNGEIIRVLDVPTGRVCFDLTSPKKTTRGRLWP